jgi:hypothetical protein
MIFHEMRHHPALRFTNDNQPWLLWVDAEETLPKKPRGTTYHLVNAATSK